MKKVTVSPETPNKCPKCSSLLLSVYYRDNEEFRKWVKIEGISYCRDCEKMVYKFESKN